MQETTLSSVLQAHLGHLPPRPAEPRTHISGEPSEAPCSVNREDDSSWPISQCCCDNNMEVSKTTATHMPRVMCKVGATESHLTHIPGCQQATLMLTNSGPESCVRTTEPHAPRRAQKTVRPGRWAVLHCGSEPAQARRRGWSCTRADKGPCHLPSTSRHGRAGLPADQGEGSEGPLHSVS